MSHYRRFQIIAAALLTLTNVYATADVLWDVKRDFGPEPETADERWELTVPTAGAQLGLQIAVKTSEGRIAMRVIDAAGNTIVDESGGIRLREISRTFTAPEGVVHIELSVEDCVGKWQAFVVMIPPPESNYVMLVTGPLMVVMGLVFVGVWYRKTRVQLRWFWVGAGAWTLGVALKFAWAIPTNGPVLGALEGALPHGVYVALGSLYIGVLTGVFEIGITLALAWKWRRLAETGERAVAVGIGAGSIEAILLGLGGFVQVIVLIAALPGTEAVAIANAYMSASTPLVWLVGPIERTIAILCHTSSRVLVLLSVARHRWSYFWYGFLILTGIDTLAGWLHLSGNLGHMSMWWVELMLAPFAVASVPIIRGCLRRWPGPAAEAEPAP